MSVHEDSALSDRPLPPYLRHILFVLLLFAPSADAQDRGTEASEHGRPFYTNAYSAHEYRAYPQNWSITQGPRGLIYVGNFDGVLVFDGASWTLVETPTNTTARSLAARDDGRVFVGLQGDIGYVAPDSTGKVVFTSLLDRLPEGERDFRDVWGTHVTGGYVFFQTTSRLLRWDGEDFKIWHSETGFHTSFEVGGEVFVREARVGLRHVANDSLQLVAGGERLAYQRVYMMGQIDEDELILGTREEGLLLYKDGQFERFRTDADGYLARHRLYHGTTLEGGYVALGFLDAGGLMILDREGRIVSHFTEKSGLADAWVNHVFRDAQGGLWLALNNRGIVRIDPLSKITRFDGETGLDGVIGDVVRYQGSVYVGSSTGLFRLIDMPATDESARFKRVDGVVAVGDILPFEDKLLITGYDAIRLLDRDSLQILDEDTYFATMVSKVHPGRIYGGAKSGVTLFQRRNGVWHRQRNFIHVGEEVRRLIEANDGTLWLLTRSNRLLSANVNVDNGDFELREFAPSALELDSSTQFAELRGKVFLVDATGYVRLGAPASAEARQEFRHVRTARFATDSLLALTEAPDGKVWQVYNDRVEFSDCLTGCEVYSPQELGYPEWSFPLNLHIDSSGVTWIATSSALIRYDPSIEVGKTYEAIFPALLRRVTAIDSNQRLYDGIRAADGGDDISVISELHHAQNALRFEFALPSYNDPAGNEFQFRLEGRDKEWSEWTKETSKNYTNLWEGTYRFHIRGRNAQGYVSSENVYSFTILPPWYRSTWAYGVYFCGLIGLGLFVRRHRRMVVENKRAKQQAKELARERQINERLHDLNKRLEQANETLRQADRLKDEFLANTSHELRTPLTGILGCSSILRAEVNDDQLEFVNMIDENGQRLLNTLDSLLDLARLRAGLMDLEFKELDLGRKAEAVASSYSALAESKGVDIRVSVDGNVRGWYDDHCLECVLNHLVGNAVKFTEDGEVHVRVTERGEQVIFRVEDTGVGIDSEFMPFLFDEFKQESTGLTRSHEGNGLGLAVTARIIDLMGGDIEVESEKYEGTTFTVRIPLERRKPGRVGDGLPKGDIQVDATASGSDLAAA